MIELVLSNINFSFQVQPMKIGDTTKFVDASPSPTFLELEDNTTHEIIEPINEVCKNDDLCIQQANYVWLGSNKCDFSNMANCNPLVTNWDVSSVTSFVSFHFMLHAPTKMFVLIMFFL